MKVKRLKRVNRYITFFSNNYGFRSPYQILIDGTFCQVALQSQVNIKEQLPKYLGSEVQIVTTSCIVQEVDGLGEEFDIYNHYVILIVVHMLAMG